MTMTTVTDTIIEKPAVNDTNTDTHNLSTYSMQGIRHLAKLIIWDINKNDHDNIVPLKNFLKSGNTKIPSSTAIFNMSSAHNCPSKRLGLCKAAKAGVKCYAIKSEVGCRPSVQPYRERQTKFWLSVSAEEFASQFLMINALKPIPFNALRMNEAGDFHSQECVNKAEKIARILKLYGIIAYCYTSRDDLDYTHVEALRISGSGFKKQGIVNVFQIIEKKEDKPKGYGICPMNCRICNRCQKAGLRTAVLKH